MLVVLVFVCWRAKSFCLIKTEALCWCFCFWNFLLVISLENPSFPRLGIWIVKMDSNSTKEKLQNSVAVVADRADLKSCYMQKFRLYETRSVNIYIYIYNPFSSLIIDVSCVHYKYSIFLTMIQTDTSFCVTYMFLFVILRCCLVWFGLVWFDFLYFYLCFPCKIHVHVGMLIMNHDVFFIGKRNLVTCKKDFFFLWGSFSIGI